MSQNGFGRRIRPLGGLAASGMALVAAGSLAMSASAQPLQARPDAGTLLRDGLQTEPAHPESEIDDHQTPDSSPPDSHAPTSPAGQSTDRARIAITSISIAGNSVFDDQTLLAELEGYQHRRYELAGLQALAGQIAAHYRDNGYPFVRAVLPPQEIGDGSLTIEVVEGRYGQVRATGDDAALARAAQRYLDGLRPGAVIAETGLERATRILDDLPGMDIAPVLRPGQSPGTGDLEVEVEPGRRWAAVVSADNYGNRYSGPHRARIALTANRLLMVGDEIAFSAVYTDEDLWLGSLDYSVPVGISGLRASAGFARTEYRLGDTFSGFTGTATVGSLGLSHPVIRRQSGNLTVSAEARYKVLEDQLFGRTFDRKDAYTGTLGLTFDRRDRMAGGGVTYGGLSATGGVIDNKLPGRDGGAFLKLNGRVARLQNLPGRFSLQGSVRFQAGDDLDGSESFSLGGPNAVRSHPAGEASASAGILGRTELRYTMETLAPYLFADFGHSTGLGSGSPRSLAGAGFGIRATHESGIEADAAVAWQIGSDDAVSDDRQHPRVWLSVRYRF